MRSEALNAAVIGLGVGNHHVEAYTGHSSCHLLKIADLDPRRVDETIRVHHLQRVQKSTWDDILKDKSIQIVSIATFDDQHSEQVIAGLKANKHVFVEKPLCQTRKELKKLHKTFIKSNTGLSSNLVLRTAPLYMHVKKLIDQGKLGDIYAFDGDYLYGRVHKITDGWRKNIEDYSVMVGGGIHMIDLMLWLTGQKPTFVSSQRNKIATHDTDFKYPDFQSSTFLFKSGLIGRITANFGCMHKHQHVVRIFGSKGTFIYDDQGARIHWSREENSQPEILKMDPTPTNKGQLIHNFVNHILEKKVRNLAVREFDLMSVAISAVEAKEKSLPLKIEYLPC